ncbi:hypothetical protein BJF78_07345 [Pseudonocardia sp. CNS-139]|nr:hypothetical protein BJF78_07345 [Pseudonocardia sp. CNS-139]
MARLGERDRVILQSLADFRLLTGRQLQQLHVDSSNPGTAARRTRAVMRRLSELRVVVRLDRRVGGIHAGSEGYVYSLSGLGYAVLALDGHETHRGRTIWETKPAFQDHVLAIAELFVELHGLQRSGEVELLDFEPEPRAWRTFSGPAGQALPVKPDAFVAVAVGEYEQRAFVEVDLGTESLPTIRRKCRRYLDYWRSGSEQQRHGVFPRVWWLAATERRLRRLAEVVAEHRADEQPLFAVALAPHGPRLLAGLPLPGGTA